MKSIRIGHFFSQSSLPESAKEVAHEHNDVQSACYTMLFLAQF